ncbi:MAG: methyltransferase domain-containing protein [Candidatus Bathyarchaeia archaeon]
MLGIGSGFGDLAIEFSKHSKESYGIEPGRHLFNISNLKKEYYGRRNVHFELGSAEKLPYKDRFFDLVLSKTVLEHVKDVEKSIKEMSRVTKPGGLVYIEAPNYFWIKEGHYNIFMLPLMPKSLFKLYARILGKDPSFIDHINYITPSWIRNELESNGFEIHDLYREELRRILIESDLREVASGSKLKWLICMLYALRLNGLIFWVFTTLGFCPSIVMLGKKK